MSFVVVGEVADASGEHPFQFPVRLSSRLVIVKQAVDAPVPVQHIYGFGNIGDGIEDDVILPVKVGYGRAVLHPQRKEGKIVRHALEYEAFLSWLSMLPDMADVLRGDTALKETVAHFISSRHVRETDGEIRLAVMDEVQFPTLWLCQSDVYTPFLQVAEQCRMGKFSYLQMLDACWRKEKDTGRMCGACSAILPSR